MLRRSLIVLVAAPALLTAGCGDKISNVTQGEDEGTFVDVGLPSAAFGDRNCEKSTFTVTRP